MPRDIPQTCGQCECCAAWRAAADVIAATPEAAPEPTHAPDTAEWWRQVAQGLGVEVARIKRLAKEAANGWACHATRTRELDEIARLHREIDAIVARNPADAGGCAELKALVREWQIARRPSQLPAPGVDVVKTYRHAVLRMTVVDEALARFQLDGPAGGALVGQTTPTESTGPFTDEYAVETLTHLARTLPEIDEQHSCLRGALAIKAIAARARGVGRAVSNARAVYLAPPEAAACVQVGDVVNAEPVDVDPDLVVSVEAGMVSTQQGDIFPLSSVRHVWKPAAPPEAAPTRDCADDVCQAAKHDGILCADGECDYRSGIRKPPSFADDRERVEGLAAIMAVSPSDEDRVYAASLRVLLAERDAALNHHCSAERPCLMCQREREARAQTWAEVLAYVEQAATRQIAPGQREAFLADVLAKVQSEAAR